MIQQHFASGRVIEGDAYQKDSNHFNSVKALIVSSRR